MFANISSVDKKFKAQGYTKTAETEHGVVYIRSERFGISELRVYKTSDDILTESVYTLAYGTDNRKVPYALSYKTLKLIDKKIREMKKSYNWVMCDDDTRSRNTDTE